MSEKKTIDEKKARDPRRIGTKAAIAAYLETSLEPMRARARELGYAIAVHGSLARDIDLVAIPWSTPASSPQDLVVALLDVIREVNDGRGYIQAGEARAILTGTVKPHGRRAWSIFVDLNDVYFDISIMPRAPG